MPELVSKPKGPRRWSATIKCRVCGYSYKYSANEVVLGERSDPDQGVIYCGNCNSENVTPPLGRKARQDAHRY